MTLRGVRATDLSAIQAGDGTATFAASGIIDINTTGVGTDADTNEKTLMSYSIPANTLANDGDTMRVTVVISLAANGNLKQVSLKFGATTFFNDSQSPNDKTSIFSCTISRTGVGAQDISQENNASGIWGAGKNGGFTTTAEDETGAILFSVTGQNGVASANDIVCQTLMIEYLGA